MSLQRYAMRIIAVCLAVALASAGHAEPLKKATLRVDWTILGYHAPFFLGVAKGYYRDAGIDLTILEGNGSANVTALVGNGNTDFGFVDASTAAQLIAKGMPVKVITGIFQRSTLALFYPVGKGISKPSDLRNKRILSCPTDGLIKYLPAYLRGVGLTMDDVKITTVDCSIKYSYLAQGRGDAASSYGTAGKPLMQAVGIADVGKFDYADAGIVLPSHGIVASTDEIKNDPEKVRRFVSASVRAWIDAREHPDEAVAAVIAANPLLDDKRQLLKDTLVASLQYIETPATAGKPFGWQSPEDWSKATKLLVEMTDMQKPESSSLFFTNEFITK